MVGGKQAGFIRRLQELVEQGRLNFWGAYYEPILPVIGGG